MPEREANPILAKELRARMRGRRAFVILTAYLAVMSAFSAAVYYLNYLTSQGPGGIVRMAPLGRPLFFAGTGIQLIMVVFLTPAFVTGAIAGERERQTFELLRTTLLPARALVGGKLVASLSFVLLLILAAVPVQSLAFVLGGVTVLEIGLALLILVVSAVASAILGLFFSSVARSTLNATVMTYGTALFVNAVLPLATVGVVLVLGESIFGRSGASPPPPAVQVALVYAALLIISISPLAAAIGTEVLFLQENSMLYYWQSLESSYRVLVPSPWIVLLVIYVVVSALLLRATVVRVGRQACE